MATGLALAACLCWAIPSGGIRGRVTDPSQNTVPGAAVNLTNAAGAVLRTSTGVQGTYAFNGLAPGRYTLTVAATGFQRYSRTVTVAGVPVEVNATLALQNMSQSVMVRAGAVQGATEALTPQQVFQSAETIRVLNREQINALSPVSGSAQIVSVTPGANVTGYGNTGATKNTVTLNGVQQGWGGFGGYTTSGALAVTFDGIPVVDAATGLWQSNMFPQSTMINSTSVVYGPGDPAQRWYTNVGGGVEYTPLQPVSQMHASLSQTLGSYGQENTAFELTSGSHQGWSAVLAGGHGSGNSFRIGSDGFNSPNSDVALYGKLIKQFRDGDLQLGGYSSDSSGYRPQVLPVTAQPGITVNGVAGGPEYSQTTSGFYSTVAYATYNKFDKNLLNLFWAKLNVALGSTTTLQEEAWFSRINRLHDRIVDAFTAGTQQLEWNNPYTKMFGTRIGTESQLPGQTVELGGFYVHSLYNSRNNFYNPADGGSKGGVINIGGKARSSYFSTDLYALYAQDQVRPWHWLTITPGIRYMNNAVDYADHVSQDFVFAPGVVAPSHCLLNGVLTSTPGNITIQSASCGASESRGGFEPSLNLALSPRPWLSLYGGFSEELKAPQLGGGGGFFQGVDPNSYHLARAEYAQGGVKLHVDRLGPVARLLTGVSYFHLRYTGQELDVGLANGDTISSSASSFYQGVNAFADADATQHLHVFANATIETARYSSYVVGESVSPAGVLEPGSIPYTGLPVPYVPHALFNVGAYYTIPVSDWVVLQPRAWYGYTGTQTMFDNNLGHPSTQTMATFGTLNLGVNVPIARFNLRLTALNVTNRHYNQFVYISSGSYFGTPAGGYALAYPGAPFTMFGAFSVRF